ncbi:hypothetical protein ACIHDR_19165 [Nocardia sp. NPDC052278]|uniref:hypothetical protein n=1 Tax=unclassified Nocardia TaxID=2637762 RepID=UPI0036A658CB
MTDTAPVGASTGGAFGWTPIDGPQADQARANLIDYDRTFANSSGRRRDPNSLGCRAAG